MLLIALFGLSLSIIAQTSRGTVSGLVSDPAGAVIPGATVTLTSTDTNTSRTSTTNDEGFYRFDAVELGPYSVTINATGFGELLKTNIIVNANQTSAVDAQLAPGGQQVTVDVIGEAGAALQTEAPVRGGNISARQVTELPFAGRNPTALALTLPGVSTNRTGVGIATFSVNGARGRSNNFLIDGTENNDISVAGQGFQITNPDAVAEVSIQTSNYDAEFGRAGGAVVNTITRSGTNEFHGTLSYLLDSRVDDAVTSSESRQTRVQQEGLPFGIDQYFSGTFGGPIVKNRTFFFGAYQEQRQRANQSVTLTTPTAAGRATLRSLFPAGSNANVDSLLNFTAATVGVDSRQLVALGLAPGVAGTSTTDCNPVPAGNRPCVEIGAVTVGAPFSFTDKQGQIRIDHRLTENNQLSGRYLFSLQDVPNASPNFPGFGADQVARYHNFLVANTFVLSPRVTNETRIAYNRIQFNFPLSDPGGPAGTFPSIRIGGFSNLGASVSFPQGRTANNYVVQDTITFVSGDHTYRIGGDFLRQISTQAAPFAPRGIITYGTAPGYTSLANFVDNFGGASGGSTQRDFGSAVYFPSLYRIAVFAQDRWRATDSLTFTYGLRYENFGTPFNTLRTPAFTGLFNINPVTLTGPFSEPNDVFSDNNNLAPTLGLAYSPSFTEGVLGSVFGDKRSVLRAGYQIGYDSFFNNIASNAAASSPNLIATALPSSTASNARGTANFSTAFPTVPNLNPRSAQTLIARNLKNPYYQRFSLGMQRELPFNLIMDISYVGSRGVKLYINEDANPLLTNPALRVLPAGYTGPTNCTIGGNITAAQARPGFPAGSPCPITGRFDNLQGGRTVRTNGGASTYHSGQLEVRRRFADNFTITGAYTFSKLISNSDEVFATGIAASASSVFAVPSLFGGGSSERALSQFDRTHRASFTYVYEIPYFREQNGALGRLLGGFQFSGVTSFESGIPFTVLNLQDADGVGGNNERPTFNPAGQRGVRAIPVVNATTGAIIRYTNPETGLTIDPLTAQFIVNPAFNATQPLSVPRVGNLGRNTERSPGINNWNVNIIKRTNITENTRIEFRTEFFNIFNHPQFGIGSVSPFSPGGGTIVSNANTTAVGRFLNPNPDSPDIDGGGRVIRYQLKFIF